MRSYVVELEFGMGIHLYPYFVCASSEGTNKQYYLSLGGGLCFKFQILIF